jgi:arsenite methyltransferase
MIDTKTFQSLLAEGETKACCAALYETEAVRWFLGGELHPGGEQSTRRALELLDLGPGDRLLDVASGSGTSALLAARERGCEVVGVDLAEDGLARARSAANAAGLGDRVSFSVGDAEALPFVDESFDAVLCECSLSTFPDKEDAVNEMRRVLRPGGRVAISDVVVDEARLPDGLRGPIATLACVGGALTSEGYEQLLEAGGLDPFTVEPLDREAARLAGRLEDRLRFGRLLDRCRASGWCPFGFDEAIAAVRLGRRAIDEGSLGYSLIVARC